VSFLDSPALFVRGAGRPLDGRCSGSTTTLPPVISMTRGGDVIAGVVDRMVGPGGRGRWRWTREI